MNNAMMNPALNSTVANSLLGAGANAKAQAAVQNGDFFAAFLEMLTGQAEGTGVMSNLGLGIENGYVPAEDEEDAKSNQAAMEMAAGLLSGNYGFDWLLSGNMESNELSYFSDGALSGLSGGMSGILANGQQADMNLAQLMGGGQGNENPLQSLLGGDNQDPFAGESSGSKILSQMMLLQNLQGAVNSYKSAEQAAAGNLLPNGQVGNEKLENSLFNARNMQNATSEAQNLSEMKNISVFSNQNSENSSEMLYNGDMGFKTAVAQAQRLIKKGNSSEEEQSFEIASADAGSVQMQGATNGTTSATEATKVESIDLDDLTQQINAGLTKGELTEKKELSVKLKPEGLGEVTIKLVKEANQIKISIVTAGEQTARLLNDNLPTLKQSMQSMGADVNEVFVERQTAQAEQGFLNNQAFNGQQNTNEHGSHRHAVTGQGGYFNGIDTEQNEASPQRLVESGMRIYA